jgi:LysM repeat protein
MLMRRFLGILAWFGIMATVFAATTHTVQKGETFYQIAKARGTSPQALMQANPSVNPQRLHAGDILQLPTAKNPPPSTPSAKTEAPSPAKPSSTKPEWVKVKKGDTLAKISREQAVSIEDLRKWNSLKGDTLHPDDLLRLQPPKSAPQKIVLPPPTPLPSPLPQLTFLSPARAQIDSARDHMREWEYIVVHHSGTSGGNATIFDAYHKERGMENGMAYHFVIGNGSDSGNGQIEVGNRWRRQIQGGHLASDSLNEIAIGICLVGDFTHHQPSPRQIEALTELVQHLREISPSPRLKFRLHREINTKPTECPGKLFPSSKIHEVLD